MREKKEKKKIIITFEHAVYSQSHKKGSRVLKMYVIYTRNLIKWSTLDASRH